MDTDNNDNDNEDENSLFPYEIMIQLSFITQTK